tara:strand:- start:1085 stop:1807 length:723 start_codon:yes stop_codon:yes gene_type:complete
MKYKLNYKRYGKNSILVEWPKKIDEKILNNIIQYKSIIQEKINVKSIKNSYNSLLISFKIINNFQKTVDELKKVNFKKNDLKKLKLFRWYLPVCYDTEFGIDLNNLEKKIYLNREEIIQIHSSSNYKVYNIGFIPGFLYLGGLNKKIQCPRKKFPVLNIKKGSVGIGGSQTGVYPQNSPGGWNIIGNSPINLFDPYKNPPCFIKTGDEVKFFPVSKKDHEEILLKIESNNYEVKKILMND